MLQIFRHTHMDAHTSFPLFIRSIHILSLFLSLFFSLALIDTRVQVRTCTHIQAQYSDSQSRTDAHFVVAELTEISTRSRVATVSRSLIPKPYNFYTWHTPNMAGRQSLYLITYSDHLGLECARFYKPLNLFPPSIFCRTFSPLSLSCSLSFAL